VPRSDYCFAVRGNGLILGAGILGSALAAELSRKGVTDLHVVDIDLEGSLSSTERNAGGVRHLWQQPINVELARHTISYIREHAQAAGFQNSGYLWLYAKEQAGEAEAMAKRTAGLGLSYEALTPEQIQSRYPFIDRLDNLSYGLFGKNDGLINSNGLKTHFRDVARSRGVTFHDGVWVKGLKETASGIQAQLGRVENKDQASQVLHDPSKAPTTVDTGDFSFVILAGGAWTRELLAQLVKKPLVKPIRRQICVFKADDFDMTPYGMVVDTSGVYFHPEGGNVLSGFVLKNEPEAYRFDYDADFFESHIWPALYERSSKFERLKWVTGWGGLYSYTPDTSGLLGRLPGFKNVFEAHSFTGRGVMQCHGAAIALSELIVDGGYRTLDASVLSRERFEKLPPEKWLHEGLHI
jgi:FAD-dependent oxidoreductase domain-containing protein 1